MLNKNVSYSINDSAKTEYVIRQEEAINPLSAKKIACLIVHEQEQSLKKGDNDLANIAKKIAFWRKVPAWIKRILNKTDVVESYEEAKHTTECLMNDCRMQKKVAEREIERLDNLYFATENEYALNQEKYSQAGLINKLARQMAISIWCGEHGLPTEAGESFFSALEGLPPESHILFFEAFNRQLSKARIAGIQEREAALKQSVKTFGDLLMESSVEEREQILAHLSSMHFSAQLSNAQNLDFSNISLNGVQQ